MSFAWKVMVPLSFYTVIVAAVYRFYEWPWWSVTLLSVLGLAVSGWIIYRRMSAPARRVVQVRRRVESMQQRASQRRT